MARYFCKAWVSFTQHASKYLRKNVDKTEVSFVLGRVHGRDMTKPTSRPGRGERPPRAVPGAPVTWRPRPHQAPPPAGGSPGRSRSQGGAHGNGVPGSSGEVPGRCRKWRRGAPSILWNARAVSASVVGRRRRAGSWSAGRLPAPSQTTDLSGAQLPQLLSGRWVVHFEGKASRIEASSWPLRWRVAGAALFAEDGVQWAQFTRGGRWGTSPWGSCLRGSEGGRAVVVTVILTPRGWMPLPASLPLHSEPPEWRAETFARGAGRASRGRAQGLRHGGGGDGGGKRELGTRGSPTAGSAAAIL